MPPPSFPKVLVRRHLCKCTSDVEIVSLFTTSFTKNYGSRPLLACLVFLVHRILMHKENKVLIFNTAATPKQSTVTALLKLTFYFMGQSITKNIASRWRNHFILVKIGKNRIDTTFIIKFAELKQSWKVSTPLKVFKFIRFIHWVNSSAQGSCFHKMTDDISSG